MLKICEEELRLYAQTLCQQTRKWKVLFNRFDDASYSGAHTEFGPRTTLAPSILRTEAQFGPRNTSAPIQGISVQNDKDKIIIKVDSSYIRKHLWWLACCQESTIGV